MSTRGPAGLAHNPARRQALSCLAAWTGAVVVWTVATGAAVVWTVAGGVPRALGATNTGTPAAAAKKALTNSGLMAAANIEGTKVTKLDFALAQE